MSVAIGWALAALALAVGWINYGVQGLIFGVTIIFFWLALQFNRSVRALRRAGAAPVGSVDSAVMLNAKLRPGMRLVQVLELTRSLGRAVSDEPEVWSWQDPGGSAVELTFVRGRLGRWSLRRPPEAPEADSAGAASGGGAE